MSSEQKDTIYIDVEDDITGIVDKVKTSPKSIVALVLPKRASVLQSIVNMKLLKRSADQAGKKAVLITSESGLLPLAGAAGVHVAPNLQSKPEIPAPPDIADSSEDEADDVPIASSATVGEAMDSQVDDAVEVDNTPPEPAAAVTTPAKKAKKGFKTPKVPNFKKGRKLIIIAVAAAVLLVGFLIWALAVAPKAVVTVRTETSDLAKTLDFELDKNAEAVDLDNKVIPASVKEITKTETEKVPTTGQKDKGNKASGTVSLKNCSESASPVTVKAGTGISSGNLTYLTQQSVTLPPSVFNGLGACTTTSKSVSVVAKEGGDQYNQPSGKSYSVSGHGGVIATGETAMTGGTTNVVKVVSKEDVEKAKQQIAGREEDVTSDLQEDLKEEGLVAIIETLKSDDGKVTVSPEVGTEASEVTVTSEKKYTMLGVKEDNLKEIIKKQTEGDIDKEKQAILKFGIEEATFKLDSNADKDKISVTMETNLVIGPDLKQDQIKTEIAGKKRQDAEAILSGRPGFRESSTKTKPFWVKNVPKNPNKIEFVIEEADGEQITQ